MGILNKKKEDRLSGRLGDVVYYWRNGRQLFRSYVAPVNPKTPAQKAQRTKLSVASTLVSHLYGAIKHGHRNTFITFGTICGRVMREAITGESPHFAIDYSKIRIAEGPLQKPLHILASYDPATRQMRFTWDSALVNYPSQGRLSDRILIVSFLEKPQPQVKTHVVGSRGDKEATFTLPEGWNPRDTHFWLYVSSLDGEEHSGSEYVEVKRC